MMEKQEYIQPIIQSLGLDLETFICLSVPIGTGTGSGGGGDAKNCKKMMKNNRYQV